MKIILDLAVSADGFIADTDGNSSWVSPLCEKMFLQRAQETGCVVIGRKTFEQYQNEIYPLKNCLNIVLTAQPSWEHKDCLITASPIDAIRLAKENIHEQLLVAGGGKTSAAFMHTNLVDEIFLSVHPLILGEGIKPFSTKNKLHLLDTKSLGGDVIELHYLVNKD